MATTKHAVKVCISALLLAALAEVAAWDGFASTGYAYGAAAYLDRPAHAYSASLGKAVTAWPHELAGLQYNPAILDAARSMSIIGSYSFLTDDRKFIAADGAVPIGEWVVLGASFRCIGVEKIEQRDEYGYLGGTFEDRETETSLGVAGRFLWNISGGVRARYLNQRYTDIPEGNAHGMGFDAGALWQPNEQVSVGVSGLNLGSYLWWATGHRDIVLTQARVGVAGAFFDGRLVLEVDGARTLRQPLELCAGLEYTAFGIISARAGISSSVDIRRRHSRSPDISVGAGVRYSFFGFDYSLVIPTDNAQEMLSHKVSLVLNFNLPGLL